MSIQVQTNTGKHTSDSLTQDCSPEDLLQEIDLIVTDLRQMVDKAATEAESFDSVERDVWRGVLHMGRCMMDLFIHKQGDGDLGEQVTTSESKSLKRSDKKKTTTIRSVFGEHQFEQFDYSPGRNQKIELRPISARMKLPQHRWSHLLQEFSQAFCVDQAFNQAARSLELIFGAKFSVDTLEQTNMSMGVQAGDFLDALPTPEPASEREILVASADCKGVPLIKAQIDPLPAFEQKRKRPGNRRMATVATVYTVDPHMRTAEDVVSALFRDPQDRSQKENVKRPRPVNKLTTAHFPTTFRDGETDVHISGVHEGMVWLSQQVHTRQQADQEVVLIMDGQEFLWDVGEVNLEDIDEVVEILDIIHVSQYVWEAAGILATSESEKLTITRDRLKRILEGQIDGVICGLRRMATTSNLPDAKRLRVQQICGYFEKHQSRMQYDEYLSKGFPIATGPVEGACGHLVKDRMERSGMRWTLEGARNMLNVRAAYQSDYWTEFCQHRIEISNKSAHPNQELLQNHHLPSLAT